MKFKPLSIVVLSCVLCFFFSLKASNDELGYIDGACSSAVMHKTPADFVPFDFDKELEIIRGKQNAPDNSSRRYIPDGGIIVSPENAQQTKKCFISSYNDEVLFIKKHFHGRDWTIPGCTSVPSFFTGINFESHENPWKLVNRATPSDCVDGWRCYELRLKDGSTSHFFAVHYEEVTD